MGCLINALQNDKISLIIIGTSNAFVSCSM